MARYSDTLNVISLGNVELATHLFQFSYTSYAGINHLDVALLRRFGMRPFNAPVSISDKSTRNQLNFHSKHLAIPGK